MLFKISNISHQNIYMDVELQILQLYIYGCMDIKVNIFTHTYINEFIYSYNLNIRIVESSNIDLNSYFLDLGKFKALTKTQTSTKDID